MIVHSGGFSVRLDMSQNDLPPCGPWMKKFIRRFGTVLLARVEDGALYWAYYWFGRLRLMEPVVVIYGELR